MLPTPTILELSSVPSAEVIARVVAERPPSIFLDSADRRHPGSRFSYAGFQARKILSGDGDPWPILLNELKNDSSREGGKRGGNFFSGGPVGYLSYESLRFCDPLFDIPTRTGPI